MAADTPDPTRWFADLMAAQQAMWRPMRATQPPIGHCRLL